jgi:surfeit locus 1 family protein
LRIPIGSRVFAPRWFTTVVTLLLLALLISLGRWQLHRADEKRALFQAFAAGSDRTVKIDTGIRLPTPRGGGEPREGAPSAAATAPLPRYQHVEASGRYDSAHQFLLDNMISNDGRAGYFVITPFALDDGHWVLVNRGWVPIGVSRAERPEVAVDESERIIRGRTDRRQPRGTSRSRGG